SVRSADLFLPKIAASVSVRVRRRVLRCCQVSDGCPKEGARYKVRYHFQTQLAVACAARPSLVANLARTNRGVQSRDRYFSLQLPSKHASRHRLRRQSV